jgi:hypothetical protein
LAYENLEKLYNVINEKQPGAIIIPLTVPDASFVSEKKKKKLNYFFLIFNF